MEIEIHRNDSNSKGVENIYIKVDTRQWYNSGWIFWHYLSDVHGKHLPARKFSYVSHGNAGKWHRGDTESVKNLYARRWLHNERPSTADATKKKTH